MDYAEREQQKAEAWREIRDPETSLDIKAEALYRVIEAHYWRAREDLGSRPEAEQRLILGKFYYPGCHLDVPVYARHWLHANGDLVAPEVIEAFCERFHYKPERSQFLPEGMTSYRLESPFA